jgi:hypothetical protein
MKKNLFISNKENNIHADSTCDAAKEKEIINIFELQREISSGLSIIEETSKCMFEEQQT